MKFEFKPAMFLKLMNAFCTAMTPESAAQYANEILAKHLASLPVVYRHNIGPDDHYREWRENYDIGVGHDATAILFDVERIEKVCVHEPEIFQVGCSITRYKDLITTAPECKHCGKKLTATWSAE